MQIKKKFFLRMPRQGHSAKRKANIDNEVRFFLKYSLLNLLECA